MKNLFKRRKAQIRVWSITHKGKKEKFVTGELISDTNNLYRIEHEGITVYVGVKL